MAHAVVILDDEAQAQAMADRVTAATPWAELRLVRVLEDASADGAQHER